VTDLGACGICGAQRESEVAHVCATGFWAHRQGPHDPVRRPSHYTWHPSGIEPKDFVGEFPYNIGTAMVYAWRAGRKENVDVLEDLRKAQAHLGFEIDRIERSRQRSGGLSLVPETEVRDMPRP
jgi:hypothetical protein